MQTIHELENLPYIDIQDPEYVKDPHAVFDKAREQSWVARYNNGFILTEYEPMRDILSDRRWRTGNRDVTAMMGVEKGTPFERFNNHFLQALDGEQHDRIRGLIAASFTPKAADKHRA